MVTPLVNMSAEFLDPNLLKYYQLVFNKVTDKVVFCLYMLRL